MGNITTAANLNPSINNYISTSLPVYEQKSNLQTDFNNYDQNSLQSKYVTYSSFAANGVTTQGFGQIQFNAADLVYQNKSTVLFDRVPPNIYVSYSMDGTFTVLTTFSGTIGFDFGIFNYAPGDSTHPMAITIKKRGNPMAASNVTTSQSLMNPSYPGKFQQFGNVAIAPISSNSSTDCNNCGNYCNNNPACIAFSHNKTQRLCTFYSAINSDTLYGSPNNNGDYFDTYMVQAANRLNNLVNVSFTAGDTFTIETSRACTITSWGSKSRMTLYVSTYMK
jgi:hypothetical protein